MPRSARLRATIANLHYLSPFNSFFFVDAGMDTAQVLAAAYQISLIGGEIASITKLARVLFLIPVILSIGYTYSYRQSQSSKMQSKAIAIPWFIFYFMLLMIFNSLNLFPPDFKSAFAQIDKFLGTSNNKIVPAM